MDLKNDLDLSRQMLGKGKVDIPRKESKMDKNTGVQMGVILEKISYNVEARRQTLFRVVLRAKVK